MKKEKNLQCVQCDSKNIIIEEIEVDGWIEDDVVCKDCGTHMVWGGGDKYILHLINQERWFDLFEQALEFPFEAVVCEPQDVSFISHGDKVKVHELLDEDDLYGIIVSIRKGRKKYSFPMVDLEPINVSKNLRNLNEAYQYWFANER